MLKSYAGLFIILLVGVLLVGCATPTTTTTTTTTRTMRWTPGGHQTGSNL